MCGIAGIIRSKPDEGSEGVVRSMVDCAAYRGPDGRQTIVSGKAAFGHARLSIIDLDHRSDQPFWSDDKSRCIVFNGEIYNYLELRKELQGLGWKFRTEGDTEVLLSAFGQWGDECWHHLNGMWGVGIWDVKTQMLILSRDRFGVKPLYYARSGDSLVFGSEMKQVIKGLGITPTPNWTEVYRMMDRAPGGTTGTVFEGISQLPPGHLLRFNPESGEPELQRWYTLKPQEDSSLYTDPIRSFRELFVEGVRLRLRSDVPVGVCLSGGLDSSVIACVMAKELGVTPRTFSSVYAEKEYSEERFMDSVISHVGADAKKITPQSADFSEVMRKIVDHHDEPIQMPGTYSQWHVMQLAAPYVRVLLDGQGGDETVGGYYSFYPFYARSLLLDILRLREAGMRSKELRDLLVGQKHAGGSVPSFLRSAVPSLRRRESTVWKDRVFTQAFRHEMRQSFLEEESGSTPRLPDSLAREMYRQFTDTNLPMLLKYEDRLSMAFSIESRVPFLDYRLVEYCFGLSYRFKMKGMTTKWILREAFKDILPVEVYRRQDKKGFPTPLAVWMRGEVGAEMEKHINETMTSQQAFGHIFERSGIEHLFHEHRRGIANHERILFRVFTTALWFEQWYR
jgi:asparagine synthase (glutamine-hydrolysing)